MIYPKWRQSLVRSMHLHRSKQDSRFFEVANVDENGFAQNRTMVFRGFVDNSNILMAITDTRSDKFSQWNNHPFAQICWYFVNTREQFRINAKVLMVSTNSEKNLEGLSDLKTGHLRRQVWSDLSTASKEQFFWPQPKLEIEEPQTGEMHYNHSDESNKQPPSNFVLVCFIPTYVDYLNLRTKPQTREIHTIDDSSGSQTEQNWLCRFVNP